MGGKKMCRRLIAYGQAIYVYKFRALSVRIMVLFYLDLGPIQNLRYTYLNFALWRECFVVWNVTV